MRFAVVAHRSSDTNEALAGAAATLGLDSAVLPPRDALRFLEPGDVALGRLDVREALDGIESGTRELERLAEARDRPAEPGVCARTRPRQAAHRTRPASRRPAASALVAGRRGPALARAGAATRLEAALRQLGPRRHALPHARGVRRGPCRDRLPRLVPGARRTRAGARAAAGLGPPRRRRRRPGRRRRPPCRRAGRVADERRARRALRARRAAAARTRARARRRRRDPRRLRRRRPAADEQRLRHRRAERRGGHPRPRTRSTTRTCTRRSCSSCCAPRATGAYSRRAS